MSLFNETGLVEQAALEWLSEIGYSVLSGRDIAPDGDYPERGSYDTVVLTERLTQAIIINNPHLTSDEVNEVIRQVTIPNHASLLMNNQAFHDFITSGVDVAHRKDDDTIGYVKAILFDFDNPQNNDWLVVSQFTIIEGGIEKRPDLVIFVNGLPLAILELKSSSAENVGISDAYNQLQTYKSVIPSLFTYNCALVISDGINARIGTLTSNEERFMLWRTLDGTDVAPLAIPQLEVLLRGVFTPSIFLDLIQNFILFHNDGIDTFKILAGYHQYHAVNKALISTIRATKSIGDGRAGVVWHTQGSGKSFSMVFYAGKLISSPQLCNPTIVVITDRNDLDEQLFETFAKSQHLLRQTPEQAQNRHDLRRLLNCESGGVIFTTIHKFSPVDSFDDVAVLTNRHNVIVLADEAHRSQYGFAAEMVANKAGTSDIKYGYAKYMRDSLPNASYIGFTGTPIESGDKNTQAVFGDYIDIYDMTRAVEDGTTVKIYYESRIAKVELPTNVRELVDEQYDEITEYQELTQSEQLKAKWSRLEAIVGSQERIKLVARDIVTHWEERQSAQETVSGKAMIVAMSRRIAIELYRAIIELRPEWHNDNLDGGVIKVVMTGSSSDDLSWQPFIGSKRTRDVLARRMKNTNDELKIVIVRDMWLTGFDVPCMNTLYLDKPMSGHNLMQAIARVNRVFKDKQGGLIVDYIGIAENLRNALKNYTASDQKTAGVDTSIAVDIVLEKLDLLHELLFKHDFTEFTSDKASTRMQVIVSTIDYVLSLRDNGKKDYLNLVTELAKAYSLCATHSVAKEHNLEIAFHKAVKSGIIKMIPDEKKKTTGELDSQINQLISKSLVSNEVIDILGVAGLNQQNIAILSDEFLEEVRNLPHKNLAVELLNRLLLGKVKSISRKNLIQSRKLSERLELTIKKYQNRTVETTQVILELIELAKTINDEITKGQETGLSDEEIAFYDALSDNDSAESILGDENLRIIARELVKIIRKEMSVDWWVRENVQAKMRMEIRKLLKHYGYPPDKSKYATDLVMQQAKLMCEETIEY